MPVHDFDFQAPGPGNLKDMRFDPKTSTPAGAPEPKPQISPIPKNFPDETARDDIFYEDININKAEDVAEILPAGYRTMDRGMKNYLSGIRIPTKDGMRMMQVRIAGGDKTFLIWNQDLRRGRVTLPVMSVNRGSATYNSEKFSPPKHLMSRRFVDNTGSRIAAAFRPVPYLIEYSLTIWAEHKRDAEYATYQINTRFNPLAEFVIEDEHLKGTVILRWNDWTDSSDKDVEADIRPNVRYDLSITAEGWLPLPEKLLPTVLGRVTTISEEDGTALQNLQGKDVIP
jgi:translation initiation factor IF-1